MLIDKNRPKHWIESDTNLEICELAQH